MQFGQLKRREFITVRGGAAAATVRGRRAAAPCCRTMRMPGSGTAALGGKFAAAFVQRLRDLGWIEGRNIRIEYRWGEGRNDRIAECARSLSGSRWMP